MALNPWLCRNDGKHDMLVVDAEQGWGFHTRAEKLNGRMAMVGFVALLATELAFGGEAFTRALLGIG